MSIQMIDTHGSKIYLDQRHVPGTPDTRFRDIIARQVFGVCEMWEFISEN